VADWGGHPFLYEIDLFDEGAGSGNATLDLNGFDQQLAGLQMGNAANVITIALGTRTLTLTGTVAINGTGDAQNNVLRYATCVRIGHAVIGFKADVQLARATL